MGIKSKKRRCSKIHKMVFFKELQKAKGEEYIYIYIYIYIEKKKGHTKTTTRPAIAYFTVPDILQNILSRL